MGNIHFAQSPNLNTRPQSVRLWHLPIRNF